MKKNMLNGNNTKLNILLLVLFPIVVGLIYTLPLPQIVAVDSGDLLSFYGTVFGIMGSFYIYRREVNDKKKEYHNELKPKFAIKVNKIDKDAGVFEIIVKNLGKDGIRYAYVYDEFIADVLTKEQKIKLVYSKTQDELKYIDYNYNITVDSEIMDEDGYPKYVQIVCDDRDGNTWVCDYDKIVNANDIYYYPRDVRIE